MSAISLINSGVAWFAAAAVLAFLFSFQKALSGWIAGIGGAVQVFRPISNNDLIVGAVGVLQFDVVVSRLKSEYNVEAVYESVNVATARWVECADAKKFEEFKRKNESQLALDGGDNLAYIATSMVNLRLAQERYPDVQFHQTREH